MRYLIALAGVLFLVDVATGQETFRIEGVVRDPSGGALDAQVTVSATSDSTDRVLRSATGDVNGYFVLLGLAPGTYTVRAQLTGFRAQAQQVRVGDSMTTRVVFVLPLGTLLEVLRIAAEPDEAYRQADLIAHVRIVRQLPPVPCVELTVVSTLHEAVVLSVLKGTAPTTIHFLQDNSGTCIEDGVFHDGIGEREYSSGAEYVLFLTRTGNRYDRVSGGAYAFPVGEKGVSTRRFLGLPDVVGLDAFRLALRDLAR